MTGQTVRLPTVQTGFAALPEGALLCDGRYEVLTVLKEHSEVNVYQVRDNQPVRRCPNAECGSLEAVVNGSFCSACGADLDQVQPICPTYLLKEAAEPARYEVEGRLLERGLSHPSLLLPKAHFVEAPYADSRRGYLVVRESPPPLAALLPVPQELSRVLNWGLQLTRAMTYLHEQHISLCAIDLNRITIGGGSRRARWTNMNDVQFISAANQSLSSQLYAEDVKNLAQLLFYLATGLAGYDPSAALAVPAAVRSLFARAMTTQQRPYQTVQQFGLALERILADVHRPLNINLVVGRSSDVGLQRKLNEDGLLSLVMDQVTMSMAQPLGLFAVADGMGGHSAGEVAAQLSLDAVCQKAIAELFTPATNRSTDSAGLSVWPPAYTGGAGERRAPDPSTFKQWITDAVSAANNLVHKRRLIAGTDMGNTIVLAVVAGDTAVIGNVGDSRAYVITKTEIHQITTDHSLIARLVAAGTLSPEEARIHPQRNVIYRTIGDKPQVEMDLFTQPLAPGDHLLLCSDGLSGMISDRQIFDIVRQAESPQQACDRLVQAANDAGGQDNITVILVQVRAGP